MQGLGSTPAHHAQRACVRQGVAESGPGLNQIGHRLDQVLLMTPKQLRLRIRCDHSAIIESMNHQAQTLVLLGMQNETFHAKPLLGLSRQPDLARQVMTRDPWQFQHQIPTHAGIKASDLLQRRIELGIDSRWNGLTQRHMLPTEHGQRTGMRQQRAAQHESSGVVITGEMPDGTVMTERCDPLSKTGFHSVTPLGEQRFSNGRHGGRASPARTAQQPMVRRRHLLPKLINTDHGCVIRAEDIAALQRCDQVCQLALRSLRETQRGRTMIKTPAVVIRTSSGGTASPGSTTGFKNQD